jgi:hypothetical protein
MSSRKQPAGFFALFIAMGMLLLMACPVSAQEAKPGAANTVKSAHYFVAYYFHTTYRCPSCTKIEQWSEEAILTGYENRLRDNMLQWHSINVEEPAHKHFVDDYQLYTKTLILAEFKDGKQIRWKNLDQVWHLLRNKGKFIDYVRTEINDWMNQ